VPDVISLNMVNTATAVGSFGVAAVGIVLARRPGTASHPPEMIPVEIEEQIFLAEETPSVDDDIAAREQAIAVLESRLAKAGSAEERMPIRRRLRELQGEIDKLRAEAPAQPAGNVVVVGGAPPPAPPARARVPIRGSVFDPVWTLMYRLSPFKRRKRPWLAALIGFAAGAIGLILYFRKLADLVALLVLLIAMAVAAAVFDISSWWPGAAIAGFYGFIRAESSNRRLELQDGSSMEAPAGAAVMQTAGG